MWPNPQFPVDLVTLTVEIFNEKPHFLCSGIKFTYVLNNCFLPKNVVPLLDENDKYINQMFNIENFFMGRS